MKLITTSWDDGHPLDFRLAELLYKYNLAATFYIPKANAEHEVMPAQQVAELAKQFEIGGHTLSHIRLHTTDEKALVYEIKGSYDWLADLLGYEPQSFCFPGGVFHNKAIDVVYQAGYKIARTTELLSTQVATECGLTPTTLQVYEHPAFTYAKHLVKRQRWTNMLQWLRGYSVHQLPALTESYLNLIDKNGGCFHLWGHSWEIEEYNLWNKLEELFRILSDRDDFTYLPNKDLSAGISSQQKTTDPFMRVLFIHTKYKERGGEDSVVDSEMQLLKDSGHEVDVLYFDNSNHNLLNLLLLPFNLLSYWKTLRAINRFQPQVVHLHNLHFTASFSVIWAVAKKKIPMVKTLHNYRFLCPSGTLFHNNELYLKSLGASFPWQAIKDKVYRNSGVLTFWLAATIWLHKQIGTFRKINRYITLNEKSRHIFLSSGLRLTKSQVITKPNFIPRNHIPTTPPRGNHFLYIGRLSPEKGISVLLKAFAANGLPLTIIGDGPMRDDVLRQQEHSPNITWLGFQNKEVITEHLLRCSALIVPSVCYEGMPLTIAEGFAVSTPVITSRLGAMATIVTHNDNGLLFTPNDADSLNRQVYKWAHFSACRKNEFAAHALHTYESRFTPQRNVIALVAIYRAAMGKKPERKVVYHHHYN